MAIASFAAAVFLAVFGIAGPAQAQQVIVQGNQRVDSETVRSYVSGAGAGSLEEARRNLLQTGMFSDVRITRQGSQIVVRVSENRLINRVVFEGNRKVERATLEPELQTKARGAYSPAAVDADVQRILDIYRRTGRGLASVTPRVVDLPNGRIDVVFAINEGDKTGIKAINFVGNRAYSNSRLRDLMTSTESNFLSFLKNTDVYDPDRLASDQELIRRYYLKNGYADFRVLATDAQFDAARGGWIVTITVEEGEQYRVGAVNIDSRIGDVDPETLRRRVRTSAGQVYNAEAVERSLTDVTTEVARRGYAFAQVRPTGMRDPATRTINIGYVVEEGPRVYIERINVRGNTRTRDYVIRRELDVGEGDAYNKVLLDRGERRLNNLGYFKKVRVTNEPGSAPDRVIVNIDLEDQPTGAFSIAGGYSTVDGIIGEVSVSESNFLGRGHFVRLAGNWGQRAQGIDFSFTEPYFLGYRMAAGFDLFTKYSDNTKYSRYESRVTGGTLRLGLPVTEEFGFTLRYSLFQTDLKIPNTIKQPYNDCAVPIPGYTVLNPATITVPDPTDPTKTITVANPVGGAPLYPNCAYDGETSIVLKEAAGKTITSLAGVTLGFSTLDNAKNPKNGFYAELKPDIAGLGGDSKYVRVVGGRALLSRADRGRRRRRPRSGRPHPRLRRKRPAGHGPVLPRPDPRPRLRIGRHRPARHLVRRPERQRHRRHDLRRPLLRGPVSALGAAARPRAQGRDLRRRRHAVRLQGQEVLRRERRSADLRLRTDGRLRRHRRPDGDPGVRLGAATATRSARPSAPRCCGTRRSARSASTTPSRCRRRMASSARSAG